MKNIILTVVILGVLTFVGCGKETIGEQKENTINGVKSEEKSKSKIKSVREISYNAIEENGQIKKGSISYENENILIIYNEQGNKKEEIWYNPDGSTSKATYKYDAKGNQIERQRYEPDGSLDSKETYKYDEKGNKIEENWFNSDGSLDRKETYKYDEKGNKIEENSFNSDDSLNFKVIYKYDEKGNKIEENSFNSDGSLNFKVIYKYDAKGYLIEINTNIELFKNTMNIKTIYKYNEKGYLIEEEILDRGYYYKYIYTHDSHGNWIKKMVYNNNKLITLIEREIEYYK